MAVPKYAPKAKNPAAAQAPAPTMQQPVTTNKNITLQITRVTVEAYNAEHAKRVAAAVYSVDIGAVITALPAPNQPKVTPPKKTQNADMPQRGTREWETEYQIWTYAQRIVVGLNKFDYIGLEFVKGGFAEKTPAVKAMKEMSLKHKLPMMVQIHKTLKKDVNVTALAEPDMAMLIFNVEFKSN